MVATLSSGTPAAVAIALNARATSPGVSGPPKTPPLLTARKSLDRVTGSLAAAGYTRKGRPGGGIGAVHYNLYEIVNVLLGASAHAPSEAADAVRALEGLVVRPVNALACLASPDLSPKSPIPDGTKFGVWLGFRIEQWASPTPEMLALFDEGNSWVFSLIVSMSSGRRHAYVQWPGHALVHFWPEHRDIHDVLLTARRTLEITIRVLQVAGGLLADTLAIKATC